MTTPQHTLFWSFNRFLERHLPEGLYQRSLIIVIAPIVILQTIMAGIILDRHWDQVTKVLSRSLAREVGLLVELYDRSDKSPKAVEDLEGLAKTRLNLTLDIEQGAKLPAPLPAPLLSPVDTRLTRYLARDTGRPFWIDSQGQSGLVDVRVEIEPGVVFKILTDADRATATGTPGFLFWMLVSSLVLLAIAVAFLRKQIRPIVELAEAAKSFGTGREALGFHPKGAAEVREAGEAFIAMKERIARHVEQRTAMLAGVSHDLRTVLTRFRLEIAFLGEHPRAAQLKEDVEEMQRMLEAYMAFVRGDGGEVAAPQDIGMMLSSVAAQAARGGKPIAVAAPQGLRANVKPNAFRRLLGNLIGNAARHAKTVKVAAAASGKQLAVTIDDDGPGIPAHLREEVFKPFVRLDHARNQDETGTGLGLAIALDIARAHGGDVRLSDSPLGGLRAVVEIPV